MSKDQLCICGAKLYNNYNNKYCKVCSSTYDSKGKLLVSRHNWNTSEFFSAVANKSDLNQNKMHQHLDLHE